MVVNHNNQKDWRNTPYGPLYDKLALFSIQDLYDMEPTDRYDAIISVIDLHRIYTKVGKTSLLGAPEE